MASAKVILFTSKNLSDFSHPVMLRVTHKGNRKYHSLDFSCTPNQWDKEEGQFTSNYPKYKKRNRFLKEKQFLADDIIEKMKIQHSDFSFDEFKKHFVGIEAKDVFQFFDDFIERQRKTGKIGNANVYRDTKNSISNFYKRKKLSFNQVDYSFLKKYEEHLRTRGILNNSISVYMRTLRALFNKAIKENQCSIEVYPFKKYSISKLKNAPTRKALSKEEIQKIIDYTPNPNTKQERSKNIFLFSFYTRGMNFNDIAKLEWSNVSDGRIEYIRSKNGKRFSIKILPPIQKILNEYKIYNPDSKYIFPILDPKTHKTPEQIKNRIKSTLKRVNKHLKIIAEAVGIDKKLTSYIARHSYALVLKKQGVSIATISDSMGHESESVTKLYLESFGNDVLDKADNLLL